MKWVSEGRLPPVGCPLVILQGITARRCERLGHIESPTGKMAYAMRNGTVITGRFKWTYP